MPGYRVRAIQLGRYPIQNSIDLFHRIATRHHGERQRVEIGRRQRLPGVRQLRLGPVVDLRGHLAAAPYRDEEDEPDDDGDTEPEAGPETEDEEQ